MFIHVKRHLGQSLNFLHRLYFCLGFYESNMVSKKVSKKVHEVCNMFSCLLIIMVDNLLMV